MAYNIYTTEFDEVISATSLATAQELEQLFNSYSATLDLKIIPENNPKIMSILSSDKARKMCVSILLDNSGSLTGKHLFYTAQFTAMLGDILDGYDIPFEILGYTTSKWKGGRSREKWLAAGRPNNPGRLNDLRHIIYKEIGEPWSSARKNLSVMMKKGVLKENIDGEALQWAHERISRMPHKRKIIIPVSDGAPVDDSTLAQNKPDFLTQHLHEVIKEVSDKGTELYSVGVNYKSSEFYTSSTIVTNDTTPIDAIIELLKAIQNANPASKQHHFPKKPYKPAVTLK